MIMIAKRFESFVSLRNLNVSHENTLLLKESALLPGEQSCLLSEGV